MYMGDVDLTISRRDGTSNSIFGVNSNGYISDLFVSNGRGVRPVFYLNTDVEIIEGHAGTVSDPYRIVI